MSEEITISVKRYLSGRLSRREIISVLTPTILIIPKLFKNYDPDIRSEFYMEILGSIEKIVSKYKEIENCRFETWFIFVLKRCFVLYLRRNKKRDNLCGDRELDENKLRSHYNDKNSEQPHEHYKITNLTDTERTILKYKFGFYSEDLITCDKVEEKMKRKISMEIKMNSYYQQLLKIQMQQKYMLSELEMAILKEKEQRIYNNKRKIEKVYAKYKIQPSNRWIAEKLDIAEGTVSSLINRIRDKIKRKYGNNFDDK